MAWKPGESGNPAGRASTKPWTDAINRAIKRRDSGEDPVALEKLADKLVQLAEQGDLNALKELGSRLEGQPTARTELSGPDGSAIPIGIDVRFNGGKDNSGVS